MGVMIAMCIVCFTLLVIALVLTVNCFKINKEFKLTNERLKEDLAEFEFKNNLKLGKGEKNV